MDRTKERDIEIEKLAGTAVSSADTASSKKKKSHLNISNEGMQDQSSYRVHQYTLSTCWPFSSSTF
jgi:hypothetical protein